MAAVSNVNLLVASLQLQLTQSIITAIRTADLTTAAQRGSPGCAVDTFCCCERRAITPQPRYLPRRVLHPTPRYLPRPVLHPRARIEPLPAPPAGPSAKTPKITAGPQPPWKTVPWQEPLPPADVIKIVVRQPDTVTKGTLIDLFL